MNSESTNGSHYFFYCKPDQADSDLGWRADGSHMASDQFGKLNVGDVVWSITCIKSRLYAFHRIIVATIKTQSQLDLEDPDNDRYIASHHVFANSKTPLVGVELTDIAASLRFDGTVTKLPDKFNGRNFQSMRMLTPESVELVQRHWDDVHKQPVGPILDAIREMEEVEFLIPEYGKENAKLHFVQTSRLITLHILLVSGVNAAVALKRIADSLRHIANIHELHLMGETINDTVICCLQGLDNVSQIVCHDTIVSNNGCQALMNLLANTTVSSLRHAVKDDSEFTTEDYYYDLAMRCRETTSAISCSALNYSALRQMTWLIYIAHNVMLKLKILKPR